MHGKIRLRGAPGGVAMRGLASRALARHKRRASRLAPYRHYTRVGCATITHAHYADCAPRLCPVVRSRCGRARCPHRAAAPTRGARLGK